MGKLLLDSIAVDCNDAVALSSFYASLLGVENRGDFFYLPGEQIEIWFQEVEDYRAPTWPTQERGQQVHFELVTNDIPKAVDHAIQLGATKAPYQPSEDEWVVMLDPVGHPFCLGLPFDNLDEPMHPDSDVWIALAAIDFDCPDGAELWQFYRQLAELTPHDVNGVAPALVANSGLVVLVQQVEDYMAPTWPTQDRGQQIHVDFHTEDRAGEVQRAIELGATLQTVERGFSVLLDPAGHPFCICDIKD